LLAQLVGSVSEIKIKEKRTQGSLLRKLRFKEI